MYVHILFTSLKNMRSCYAFIWSYVRPLYRNRYGVIAMPHGSVLRIEPVKAKRDALSAIECVATNTAGQPATASATLEVYPTGQGELMFLVQIFSPLPEPGW